MIFRKLKMEIDIEFRVFLVCLFVCQLFGFAQCNLYYLSTTACGSLYSEENLGGQNITFTDRDQSISLHEDQRAPIGSWPETKSIRVENSCSMNVCNDTYLDGECQKLTAGEFSVSGLNMTDIASVSCSCEKECKCEDVYMKKTSCARAYLEGGCRSCDSLYIDMNQTTPMPHQNLPKDFPEEYVHRVTALRLRKGCTLTLYTPPDDNDERKDKVIDSEIVENFQGEIGAFECECNDSKFEKRAKPPRNPSFPPLIDVPSTIDDVIKMLTDSRYATHPGLRAAHRSLKSGRSSKNAYILLLGTTGSGKSTAINVLFDHANLTKTGGFSSTTSIIHEFRIPVAIDELGVSNSELRVIDTPGLGDTKGIAQDAMFLATLDQYLANHEELKDRIPNVVLVFHKFHDNRFYGKGSSFVQMLQGIDEFRPRITDENYSNIVFVFSHFCSEVLRTKRKPKNKLDEFRRTIKEFTSLPKPIIINVAENKPNENDLVMVNGYAKLPNNEYYPKNLFQKLELVTMKGGDPIGNGVFLSAFRDSEDFNITEITFDLVPDKSDRVMYYHNFMAKGVMGVVDTEISQLLKHVWDEKIAPDLRRRFPDSLAYLQKSLNMKHVNTKENIPRTSNAILELLTSIKEDEATRVLLEKGLGIKAPVFPSNTIAGHSYDVFKDVHLPTSPFVMGELKQSDIGFMIPSSISAKLEPGNGRYFFMLDNKQSYIQHRLKSLGIEGSVSEQSFTDTLKPGHNIKSISYKNDSCYLSATREVKLFEFELIDKPILTKEFTDAVKSLPKLNQSDYETVDAWKKFFHDYGTHVVKSVYGGGAIEIELRSDKPYDSKLSKALFDLIEFAEEMSFMIIHEEEGDTRNSSTAERGVISKGVDHTLKFVGGDVSHHATDLTRMSVAEAGKLLTKWKKSLKYLPSVLTTEMRLMPMGQVVRKLGQNYSAEIEKATMLLFNSSLVPIPVKARSDSGPGFDRLQTPMMNTYLQQMADNSKMIQAIMDNMSQMEADRQKREHELNERRLTLEMEQKEKDREFQMKRLEIEAKGQADKLQWEKQVALMQEEARINQAVREQQWRQEQRNHEEKMAAHNGALMKAILDRPPIVIEDESCLKPKTKIMMVDGSQKNVEDLKIGDLVLDMNLQPTKVLGVNYEYLLHRKFYGFDNQSFFFTSEHMFVGPGINEGSHQLFVRSVPQLLVNNPLMKYWEVKGMEELENFKIFNYDSQSKEIQEKLVGVFEDPDVYPPETPVYFIRVDSPSGTYIANGYVSKLDMPPIERWAHTMALLFKIQQTPAFEIVSRVEYSMDNVLVIESLATNISQAVKEQLHDVDQYSRDLPEEGCQLMTLEDANVDESLHRIFTEPTMASFSIMMYARLGNLISPYLDPEEGQVDLDRVARMQNFFYQLVSSELKFFVGMP